MSYVECDLVLIQLHRPVGYCSYIKCYQGTDLTLKKDHSNVCKHADMSILIFLTFSNTYVFHYKRCVK